MWNVILSTTPSAVETCFCMSCNFSHRLLSYDFSPRHVAAHPTHTMAYSTGKSISNRLCVMPLICGK